MVPYLVKDLHLLCLCLFETGGFEAEPSASSVPHLLGLTMQFIKHKLSRLSLKTSKLDDGDDNSWTPDPHEEPRDSILAHSTLTTMLSHIPCGMKFSDINPKSADDTRRQELRVLNALASILVRNNEVVAVIAKSDRRLGVNVACQMLEP